MMGRAFEILAIDLVHKRLACLAILALQNLRKKNCKPPIQLQTIQYSTIRYDYISIYNMIILFDGSEIQLTTLGWRVKNVIKVSIITGAGFDPSTMFVNSYPFSHNDGSVEIVSPKFKETWRYTHFPLKP